MQTYLPKLILFSCRVIYSHWPLFKVATQKALAVTVLGHGKNAPVAGAALSNDTGMVGAASFILSDKDCIFHLPTRTQASYVGDRDGNRQEVTLWQTNKNFTSRWMA